MSIVLYDCRCGAKANIAVDTDRKLYCVYCTRCFMRTAYLKDKFPAIVCWNHCMKPERKE